MPLVLSFPHFSDHVMQAPRLPITTQMHGHDERHEKKTRANMRKEVEEKKKSLHEEHCAQGFLT